MRSPGSLRGQSIHHLRAGPALRSAQHDHRPARPLGASLDAGRVLQRRDLAGNRLEDTRHPLVHRPRIVAVHPVHGVAVPLQQRRQLAVADPRQHRWIGDLVAVQVQDREHGTVADGVEELVGVPACRQRAGLRLAVADDAADDEVGVVEGGPVRVRERVAELAALVDRSGRLGGHVRRNASGERELPEQLAQAGLVAADVGIDLAVRPLQVGVGDGGGAAVAGPDHVDHVQIAAADQPVQVRVDEVQPGSRAPVADQARFHLAWLQRLSQERVVEQVDLADGHVVGGPPVGVDQSELVAARRHSAPLGRILC